jgi:soluble lytic murein transglycosylase-like protein
MEFSKEILNYYMRYFSEWAGLPPNTLLSIAMVESSYNPATGYFRNVCNNVRACGLMQIKPIALADIKRIYGYDIDPLNPIQAIVGAALMFMINRRYLKHYTGQEPNVWALVVAYNGGWTQGRRYMQGLNTGNEQTNYVRNVYSNYYRLA